jgi:hypothetical protein
LTLYQGVDDGDRTARLATNGIELNFLERHLRQMATHHAGGTLRNTNSTG